MNYEGKESRPKQDIESNNFHIRLGVSPHASAQEVKEAYRQLARKYHPDTGGNPEDFHKLKEAYDALKSDGRESKFDTSSEEQDDPTSNNKDHSKQNESGEKMEPEKATKKRTEPDNNNERWVDTISPEERDRYRRLNRLARKYGHDEPYPDANEETLKEYLVRRKAELEAEIEELRQEQARATGPQSTFSRKSRFDTDRSRRNNSHRASFEDQGEFLTPSLNKKQDSTGDWYLVDQNGNRVGRWYKNLRTLDQHIIGINSIGSEILLDPETGRELSRQYDRIRSTGIGYEGENSIGIKEKIKLRA